MEPTHFGQSRDELHDRGARDRPGDDEQDSEDTVWDAWPLEGGVGVDRGVRAKAGAAHVALAGAVQVAHVSGGAHVLNVHDMSMVGVVGQGG